MPDNVTDIKILGSRILHLLITELLNTQKKYNYMISKAISVWMESVQIAIPTETANPHCIHYFEKHILKNFQTQVG